MAAILEVDVDAASHYLHCQQDSEQDRQAAEIAIVARPRRWNDRILAMQCNVNK